MNERNKTRYMARVLHTPTSYRILDFQIIEIDVSLSHGGYVKLETEDDATTSSAVK